MTTGPAPSKRALLFRLPGDESARNAEKLARTGEQAGLCVTMVPYWPDGQAAWHTETTLLDADIGSAPRVSEFALQRQYGLTLDLLELLAHSFATEAATPDLLLPESIWHQHLRGIAVRLIEMFERERPDVIFIAHGAEIISRLITEVAAFTGIPALFWESGFFPDHLYVDAQAPHFFRGLCASDTQPVSTEITPDTHAFIHNWRQARQSKYLQDSAHDAALLEWKARDSRPVLFVAGQVPSDANAVVGLGEHSSLEALYAAVIAKLSLDWRILFKPHPKAAPDAITLPRTIGDDLLVADIDIHTAIENSDAVLVHSSNAGLEAALRGKPVIMTGQPIYSGYGLTCGLDAGDNPFSSVNLNPPPPETVSVVVQHLLRHSLIADGNHQQLRDRLQMARPPASQQNLSSYYSQKVQDLVLAGRALHAQLRHTPKLDQALSLLSSFERSTLFEHTPDKALFAHPYGGPCAPPSVLAAHPVRGNKQDGIITLSIRLEECAFPQAFLDHALKQYCAPVRIGCRLDVSADPASAQRFSPDDIAYICAELRGPYILVENDPENTDYRLVTLCVSPQGMQVPTIDATDYIDWHIPPEAFSYPATVPAPRTGHVPLDGAYPHLLYGPYLPVPSGQWEVSWIPPSASWYDYAKSMLAWPRWKRLKMEIIEHRLDQATKVSSTPFFKFRTRLAPKHQANYEFRTKWPMAPTATSSPRPIFSGIWIKHLK